MEDRRRMKPWVLLCLWENFWKTQAFLEVELLDESDEVRLPDFIEVIRDVSADDRYRNSALAKEIPAEG